LLLIQNHLLISFASSHNVKIPWWNEAKKIFLQLYAFRFHLPLNKRDIWWAKTLIDSSVKYCVFCVGHYAKEHTHGHGSFCMHKYKRTIVPLLYHRRDDQHHHHPSGFVHIQKKLIEPGIFSFVSPSSTSSLSICVYPFRIV